MKALTKGVWTSCLTYGSINLLNLVLFLCHGQITSRISLVVEFGMSVALGILVGLREMDS